MAVYIDRDDRSKGLDRAGGWIGANNMTKPHTDAKNARAGVEQSQTAFDNMQAPELDRVTPQGVRAQTAQASTQGPTEFNNIKVDPSFSAAQRAQMAALQNLAKNGGRNAASDANLAQIQQAANANAQGQRGAIMQNARARGMGGSGNSLLAQLQSSQNATNNQSMQDMTVRGQDQQMALQAGQGAAQIGAGMQAQAFGEAAQRAAAADAISRFNAGNKTQNSQFNAGQMNGVSEANAARDLQGQMYNSGLEQQEFADQMGIQSGKQSGGKDAAEYWMKKYQEDQKTNGGLMGGAAKGIMAMFAADGGEVPGRAEVPGDSLRNDTVPVNTSPGEVIVPRTLAHNGSDQEIASFVKNPPPIERNAELTALKNLRSRRR